MPLVLPPPKTGDRDNVVEEDAGELVGDEAADVADNGEEAVEGEDITPTK